jgi:hypothetical protein
MGKYTRPVSRQQLSKHIPTAINQCATKEVLLKMGFSSQSVLRSYKEDNCGDQVMFSTGVCEERT